MSETPETLNSPVPITESPAAESATGPAQEPPASFVKLAMRNMVAKGAKSLKHFALTAIGLLTVLVGLAYLTKP
jgi:hypothetical protein